MRNEQETLGPTDLEQRLPVTTLEELELLNTDAMTADICGILVIAFSSSHNNKTSILCKFLTKLQLESHEIHIDWRMENWTQYFHWQAIVIRVWSWLNLAISFYKCLQPQEPECFNNLSVNSACELFINYRKLVHSLTDVIELVSPGSKCIMVILWGILDIISETLFLLGQVL